MVRAGILFALMLWIAGLSACAGGSSAVPCESNEDCSNGLLCIFPNDPDATTGTCQTPDPGNNEPGEDRPPVGDACDPNHDQCPGFCLDQGDGEGVCSRSCNMLDPNACPNGYQCQDIPGRSDLNSACLPDVGCGDVSFKGQCQGNLLVYCDQDGIVSFDCAALRGENGEPLQCALVSEEYGSDCISSTFEAGCDGVSLEGICDGNTLRYCESLESGKVREITCAPGETCAIDSDGYAQCEAGNAGGCEDLDYLGACDGTTALWCENDEIRRYPCPANHRCGFLDDDTGYWCIPEQVDGTHHVRGTLSIERPTLTRDGLGAPTRVSIPGLLVQVRTVSDHTTLSSTYTDQNGSFSLGYDGDASVYVIFWAFNDSAQYSISVRDCPLQDCPEQGNTYAATTDSFDGGKDFGELVVDSPEHTGAFNIFRVMTQGFDFAREHYGTLPPTLTAQWAKNSNTSCGTSCFSPRQNTLYILGTTQDPDEFDDPVIGHEFGHFLESAYSRSDSPGGAHDGSPTDPRLAWGEGYGTFVGSTLAKSPYYIDTRASGASFYDISSTGVRADISSSRGMEQLLSEYVTAEILWHIANGGPGISAQGEDPIFDVLGRYLPSQSLADRGVRGVDLVDFLDGWFCLGHGAQNEMDANVVDFHGFPYDFAGPTSCP